MSVRCEGDVPTLSVACHKFYVIFLVAHAVPCKNASLAVN